MLLPRVFQLPPCAFKQKIRRLFEIHFLLVWRVTCLVVFTQLMCPCTFLYCLTNTSNSTSHCLYINASYFINCTTQFGLHNSFITHSLAKSINAPHQYATSSMDPINWPHSLPPPPLPNLYPLSLRDTRRTDCPSPSSLPGSPQQVSYYGRETLKSSTQR